MSRIEFYSIITLILCIGNNLLAQQSLSQEESIPRNRLVTSSELISLINVPLEISNEFQLALINKDTSKALKIFVEYLKKRKSPAYFFNPEEIQKRTADFKNLFPDHANLVIENSDEFIATYGTRITWKQPGKDLLGRQHTANTIRYLARQELAPKIALSYFLSDSNRVYIEFLINEIKDFIFDYESNNTETGRNDVFERFYAGHRIRNWLFMHQVLLGSNNYSLNDQIFMLKVFILHGARLYDVCKEFNWGNHQLHGLAGLYEMSIMFPEISVMRFWNSESKKVIIEHIEKEIKPDGFQFERASHYFKLDIINYFRIYQISKINGVELPAVYLDRFHEMFEAIMKLSMPNKRLPVLQDAQDSYQRQVVDSTLNIDKVNSHDAAELRDPGESEFMSMGAILFSSPEYRFFGKEEFPSDFYWFFSVESLNEYKNIQIEIPKTKSVSLDSSGYYIMRTGWDVNDLYMIIDGGLAKYKPDHTHGGVLGIIAYAFGQEILPNYRVRYSSPSYRTMKNSLVKNVAIADHFLQGQNWISNHARTGFGIWSNLPQPKVKEWFTGNNVDFFSGIHNGFDSLGIDYERSIIFFKPYCWLVIDNFLSDELHTYQQIWQGDYVIDLQNNRATSEVNSLMLNILQADPADMEITMRKNFSTSSVQFEKVGVKNYSFFTIIYPQMIGSLIDPSIRLYERNNYKQIVFFTDSLKHMVYINLQQQLKLDELETDAELIASTYINDVVRSVIVKNGTYFTIDGININSEEKINVEIEIDMNNQISISSLDKKPHVLWCNDKLIKIH